MMQMKTFHPNESLWKSCIYQFLGRVRTPLCWLWDFPLLIPTGSGMDLFNLANELNAYDGRGLGRLRTLHLIFLLALEAGVRQVSPLP
jgi:hypothetical protein